MSAPIVIVGDSYAIGIGASRPELAYARVLSELLGVAVRVVGAGGCGFVSQGRRIGPFHHGAHQRRVRTVPGRRSLLVLQGSGNDRLHQPAEIEDAMTKFLNSVKGHSQILATGPIWAGNRRELLPLVAQAAQHVADERGFPFVDASLWYPEIGVERFLAPDGGHPNDKGHGLIAEHFARVIGPMIS